MSSSIALRRSPKPGAFTAATLSPPRSLFDNQGGTVYDTLKALREGVPPRDLKNIAPPELMRRVIRADDYQRWTKDFLGGA